MPITVPITVTVPVPVPITVPVPVPITVPVPVPITVTVPVPITVTVPITVPVTGVAFVCACANALAGAARTRNRRSPEAHRWSARDPMSERAFGIQQSAVERPCVSLRSSGWCVRVWSGWSLHGCA
ncbi:hypothetical protein ACQP1P_09645 [Dactylosporangium sp. CA-052675]|uniref:hypothetical protein n=1 Tax=Dactylosporangium sp. CA-052675 TaxID=3239927 RepID=UPI003D8DF135